MSEHMSSLTHASCPLPHMYVGYAQNKPKITSLSQKEMYQEMGVINELTAEARLETETLQMSILRHPLTMGSNSCHHDCTSDIRLLLHFAIIHT